MATYLVPFNFVYGKNTEHKLNGRKKQSSIYFLIMVLKTNNQM